MLGAAGDGEHVTLARIGIQSPELAVEARLARAILQVDQQIPIERIRVPAVGFRRARPQRLDVVPQEVQAVVFGLGEQSKRELVVAGRRKVVEAQASHEGPLTLLSVVAADPRGFGRVVRDPAGQVSAVVEEKDARPDELEIRELNASVYCFRSDWLWDRLPRLPLSAQGEYFLTDLVGMAVAEGGRVQALQTADVEETIGINTRAHLAEAETALRGRINLEWMLAGVTILDPSTTYVAPDVRLGPDTILLPNTHLEGRTSIGSGCVVGPNSVVRDSVVGDGCRVNSSMLEEAHLEADVHVGPYAHLRPGARLGRGVHMGNFGEVKNSTLGAEVKLGHFCYVGDATVGARTNIGAGTITCNFGRDGRKNRTEIGEDVFVGSDSLLVAPVRLGKGSSTGAGSVVTRDVPDGALAVGMPARLARPKEDRV